jgi:hypothetical protein
VKNGVRHRVGLDAAWRRTAFQHLDRGKVQRTAGKRQPVT